MKLLKTTLLTITAIALFASCSNSEKDGRFKISNDSDFDIDSLSITPDSERQFFGLKSGEKLEFNTKMDKVTSDGSYLFSFKNLKTNKTVAKSFGYYTKGIQLEDEINIIISNEDISIDNTSEKPH